MYIVQCRDAEHPTDFGFAQGGYSACQNNMLHQHEVLIHFLVRRQ